MAETGAVEDEGKLRNDKHAPSSGVIVRVKLRRSAGSGKVVFIVDGRSSSVRSMDENPESCREHWIRRVRATARLTGEHTFLHAYLSCACLRLLLSSLIFRLLHGPDL